MSTAKKGSGEDWRKRPRKPVKRDKHISVKVTEDELARMHENARMAGLGLAEFVRSRCLAPVRKVVNKRQPTV